MLIVKVIVAHHGMLLVDNASSDENGLRGIDLASYNYLLKEFYKGSSHELTLNENMDSSLFDETFIVFEIDSIKGAPVKAA